MRLLYAVALWPSPLCNPLPYSHAQMTARYVSIFVTALSLAAVALSLAQPRTHRPHCPCLPKPPPRGFVCHHRCTHIKVTFRVNLPSSSSVFGHARANSMSTCTRAVYDVCVCVCVRCALTRVYLTLEQLCGACVPCDTVTSKGKGEMTHEGKRRAHGDSRQMMTLVRVWHADRSAHRSTTLPREAEVPRPAAGARPPDA